MNFKKTIISLFAVLFIILLSGCTHISEPKQEKLYAVSGTVDCNNGTANSSRSVFPVVDTSDLNIKVIATCKGKDSVTTMASNNVYLLMLPVGEWSISAIGYKSDEAKPIFTSTPISVSITTDGGVPPKDTRLKLVLSTSNTEGQGTLKLRIKISDNADIKHLDVSSVGDTSVQDTKISIEKNSCTYSKTLSAGCHSLKFDFYATETHSSSETPVYSFIESVNIIAGLTTSYLQTPGAEYIASDEDGFYIYISDEIVRNNNKYVFYVDNSSSNLVENGTEDNPYKTITAAISKYNELYDKNKNIEIVLYIKYNSDSYSLAKINFDRLVVKPGSSVAIYGYDGCPEIKNNFPNNTDSSCFLVQDDASLFLNNIKISKTYSESAAFSKDTLGIVNKGTATLNNVTMTGYKIANTSNPIAISNSGNLTIDKCTINGMVNNNSYSGEVPGIIGNFGSGNIVIRNTTLTGETNGYGGGVYHASTGTVTVLGNTTFSECKAKNGGGAIYSASNSGTVQINDGVSFTNCARTSSGNDTGSTLYCYDLEIYDGVTITSKFPDNHEVYFTSDKMKIFINNTVPSLKFIKVPSFRDDEQPNGVISVCVRKNKSNFENNYFSTLTKTKVLFENPSGGTQYICFDENSYTGHGINITDIFQSGDNTLTLNDNGGFNNN